MPKLTKAVLSALKPTQIVRDTAVRGFFAEAGRTGRIALRASADLQNPTRTRKKTFGHWPELSIDDARAQAMVWIAGIRQGVDPSAPQAPAAEGGALTVARMFERAREYLAAQGRAERTLADFDDLSSRHWAHWANRVAVEVRPSELRAEHERLTAASGPVAANKALRCFRQAWNIMAKQSDDPLPSNPVRGVTFHRQRAREAVILPEDLADWFARLQTVANPARRVMHEIGLFTALRPGVLVAIERSWIDLDAAALVVPRARQKSRRDFALPLSEHLVGLFKTALELSRVTHATGPWLFPTQGNAGEWKATTVWREGKLPSETGHLLRATWRTQALACGADHVLCDMLMDHAVSGVRGVYVRQGAWNALVETQEQVTRHLLSLTR